MTTDALPRSIGLGAPTNGGGPARRAVVRWAWRLFRREWRQQLLVLTLITAAVTATILGAAIATNTPPPAKAGFGTANHLVTLPGSDPHLAADIASVKAHFGTVDVIENAPLATGLTQGADLRAQDPHGPYARPMTALVAGRYPRHASEVAMTRQLASTFTLHVGDVWREPTNPRRALRVVGLVENPQNLLDNFALLPPGQLTSPSQVTVLFDASAAGVAAFTFPGGTHAVAPQHSSGIPPATIVFAVAIVGLIFIGLVAVAGFTVLAQRRLRGLGMLSSLGATDRNVRLVMVANGALVGVIGALVGAVVGFAAWIAYAPRLSRSAHHRIAWTDLPWWLVAAALVLAILTATLASRRPARAVAQTPVVAALSGRPAPAKRVHRSALPGIVLLVVGPLLLAFSGGWGATGGKATLFQLGGVLLCAVGLLLIAPLAVAGLGVAATRAPIAARIALRDLSRYRARSAAALAASSFAVLIAMFVTLIATGRFADPVDYFGPNLAGNQVVLYAPGNNANGNTALRPGPGSPHVQAEPSVAQVQAVAGTLATSLGTHDVLALESSTAFLGRAAADGSLRGGPGVVYVATPTLLAHYGIDPNSVDPATLLITSRPGLQHTSGLRLLYGNLDSPDPTNSHVIGNPKIQTFGRLPKDTAAPNLLVTSYAVHKLKLHVTVAGWLIQAPKALSATQINAAREVAAAAGTTIEVKNDAPSLSQLRNYSTATGILLALGVLAMTVGLIRSESAGELRTLTATGASSRTRRGITAATAGALGLLAAILGTAVAYLGTRRVLPKPTQRTDELHPRTRPSPRPHWPAGRRGGRRMAVCRPPTRRHRPPADRITAPAEPRTPAQGVGSARQCPGAGYPEMIAGIDGCVH